ncbi:hypothetical protein C815_00953 [Firmicutes bacterium M10-2]|nr:hypothetical protein C815_00953 [Firmicutes bacterium M10-2]
MSFEDYCALNNVNVIYFNFSSKIRGLCTVKDGAYLIAINPAFDSLSQRKTFEHEMIHVLEEHLGSCESAVQSCDRANYDF